MSQCLDIDEVEYYILYDDSTTDLDGMSSDSCDIEDLDLSKAQLIGSASTNDMTITLLINETTIHNSVSVVAINSIGCAVSDVIDLGKYFYNHG